MTKTKMYLMGLDARFEVENGYCVHTGIGTLGRWALNRVKVVGWLNHICRKDRHAEMAGTAKAMSNYLYISSIRRAEFREKTRSILYDTPGTTEKT